jgi:hypothetical protein
MEIFMLTQRQNTDMQQCLDAEKKRNDERKKIANTEAKKQLQKKAEVREQENSDKGRVGGLFAGWTYSMYSAMMQAMSDDTAPWWAPFVLASAPVVSYYAGGEIARYGTRLADVIQRTLFTSGYNKALRAEENVVLARLDDAEKHHRKLC